MFKHIIDKLNLWYLFVAVAVGAGVLFRYYHLGASGIFFTMKRFI